MGEESRMRQLFDNKYRGFAEYQLDLDGDEVPSHDDVDEFLERAQALVIDRFDELVIDGDAEIAYDGANDDLDVAVIGGKKVGIWTMIKEEIDMGDKLHSYVNNIHHAYVQQTVPDFINTPAPFVVATDDMFTSGQSFAQAHIAQLMGEHGLSGSIVIDYWMVEIRGMTQSEWADQAKKSQGTVSANVAQARSIIEEQLMHES